MTRYVARFMKNVLGDNGHEAEICQRLVEIEATCIADAAELAKTKFCEREHVRDWLLHADRVHVTDSEIPSLAVPVIGAQQHEPGKFVRSIRSTRAFR
jgi:hypothetical protein